eukprot:Nk52_evm31s2309 gene=Nk52_evmTU31s2309
MPGESKALVGEIAQPFGGVTDVPLDKEAIHKYLEHLNSKVEDMQSQVYGAICNNYDAFVETFNYTIDLKVEVNGLTRDLENISAKLGSKEDSVFRTLVESSEEHSTLKKEMSFKQKTVDSLEKLCQIQELMDEFESDLEAGTLRKAASNINIIQTLLEQLGEDTENNDVKILKLLRGEYRKQKSRMKSQLEELWSRYVEWSTPEHQSAGPLKNEDRATGEQRHVQALKTTNLKIVTGSGFARRATESDNSLMEVVYSMHLMGMLDAKLSIFAKKSMKYLIEPLLLPPVGGRCLKPKVSATNLFCEIGFEENDKQEKGEASNQTPSPVVTLPRIKTVFDFVSKQMFGDVFLSGDKSDKPMIYLFGEKIWKELYSRIISESLAPSIPTHHVELEKYSKVVEFTVAFEREMIESGFVPGDSNELSEYVKNVNVHYAKKKRNDMLATARELMANEDHNMVEVRHDTLYDGLINPLDGKKVPAAAGGRKHGKEEGGKDGTELPEESFFAFPPCCITVRTQTIVEMAVQALEEAKTSSPECAAQLFHTCRDIFTMFRAIVPAYHSESLANVPQLSVLFHNDCMYIAHNLLTLGYSYRAFLPAPLNEAASFIDMVMPFRKLGENCILSQLEKQRNALLEPFKMLENGFADTNEDDKFNTVEKCLKQALHQLNQLCKVWKKPLSSYLFARTMGALADVVLCKIIDEIESLKDISVDETHQLHFFISFVNEKLQKMFSTKGASSSGDSADAMVMRNIPALSKFHLLGDILELGLKDITNQWCSSEHSELKKNFSKKEIQNLVFALFADTPFREEQLKLLNE